MIRIVDFPALTPKVMCVGCGSTMTDAELEEHRKIHPGVLSCCPERQPLTIQQWRDRADAFECQLRRAGMVPNPIEGRDL